MEKIFILKNIYQKPQKDLIGLKKSLDSFVEFEAKKATVGIGNVMSFNQAETKAGLENLRNEVYAAKQTEFVFDEKPISILP